MEWRHQIFFFFFLTPPGASEVQSRLRVTGLMLQSKTKFPEAEAENLYFQKTTQMILMIGYIGNHEFRICNPCKIAEGLELQL